jgi:hypothetical protein
MLRDKRKDLDGEKQKRLLQKLVSDLSRENPNVYYKSTSEIALMLKRTIDAGNGLTTDDRTLLQRLTVRDIEVLLSLH